MAFINIERMFNEMKNTMQNNFTGSTKERYNQAKELFLENIEGYIEENKEDLIKEVENDG